MPNHDDVQRIAALVAGHFIGRLPWAAGHASDMQQEAILALLVARERYLPSKGTWEEFANVVAKQAVRRYLWRFRAVLSTRPLSVGKVLEVEDLGSHTMATLVDLRTPEVSVHERHVAKRVRAVLSRLDYSPRKTAMKVALEEGTIPVLAKKAKMTTQAVYIARRDMTRRAAKSLPLKTLFEELRP